MRVLGKVLSLIALQRRHLLTPTSRQYGRMVSTGRSFSLTRQSKLSTLDSEGRGVFFIERKQA